MNFAVPGDTARMKQVHLLVRMVLQLEKQKDIPYPTSGQLVAAVSSTTMQQ